MVNVSSLHARTVTSQHPPTEEVGSTCQLSDRMMRRSVEGGGGRPIGSRAQPVRRNRREADAKRID
ncbi:hypothetical protein MUK42_32772 [Musa troglodytarum]|uniref:Uncharacterized protein n=1 Tax=Musa troglodytarum TaxID=320322 RepID=A0A9E7III4_9LILI|nr:hypothetical protein MUK42_32772 [Musa troglodytarum]